MINHSKSVQDDYRKAMRYLLYRCKSSEINIRKYQWLPYIMFKLAVNKCCYKFVVNICKQHCLDKIPECTITSDVFNLFDWHYTDEGHEYWEYMERRVFGIFGSIGYKNYPLNEIYKYLL